MPRAAACGAASTGVRSGVARAIGQQHDDGRGIGARGTGGGAVPRAVPADASGRRCRVDLGDGVDRLEDRAADRGPAAGRQALDDVEQDLLVGRRRLDDLGEARRTRRCRSGWTRPGARRTMTAAASAASRRLGGMSVAHMLRDTSIARITRRPAGWDADDLRRGGPSRRRGWRVPTRKKAKGRWRRIHDERGQRSMTRDRLE